MKLTIGVHTTQSVSPQMIASVEMLQYNGQELSEYLEKLSYENPLVELEEPAQQPTEAAVQNTADLLRWLKAGDRQNQNYYATPEQGNSQQYLHAATGESLEEFVRDQILTLEISPELRKIMDVIVELLDHRGFYTGTPEELSRLARCTKAQAREALLQIRQLEPPGVGAKNVQECLLIQLKRLKKPLATRLIQEYYAHLGTWSEKKLAKEMGVSEEAVQAATKTIAGLAPFPANGFASETAPLYVSPDITIKEEDGAFVVVAEERYLPTLRINGTYLNMLETETDPKVQAYLQEKLRQVQQVMGNLDWRKSTLVRCGEVIARRQEQFLQGGILQAMTLRYVATELELHESTVSRAVKDKYVQCSRGLLPMSAFFSRDVGQNPGLSKSYIQQQLAQIIQSEDPDKPFSDEKLTAELKKRHILMSRRGVAKYRMEMGIPTASGRKRTGNCNAGGNVI